MPSPRASAVVVALSTLVAVTTAAAALSQLSPAERAGALLPVAPIVAETDMPVTLTTESLGDDFAPAGDAPSSGAGTSPPRPGADGTSVVEPAPAEMIDTGTETETPTTPTEPTTPTTPPAPTKPGNSGNAPGQGGTSPANPGNGNGNGPNNNSGSGPNANSGNGNG